MTNKLTYILIIVIAGLIINTLNIFNSNMNINLHHQTNERPANIKKLEPIDFHLDNINNTNEYVKIVQKTLFSPERKFIEDQLDTKEKEISSVKDEDISSLKLKGIYIHRDIKKALVNIDNKKSGKYFETGDEIKGWMLSEIKQDSILLKNNTQEVLLPLHPKNENKK